ncbi:patched domain-containing protein 3-like, partial [Tropilaelaps mercedesae]
SLSVSLALCGVLVIGFIPYEPLRALGPSLLYSDDPEFLFAPRHSRAYEEGRIVSASFPTNTSLNFDVGRSTRHEAFARVIIEAKNRSVLTSGAWKDVLQLDRSIRALSIGAVDASSSSSRSRFRRTYSDLCAKDGGRCFENDFLAPLTRLLPMIEFGLMNLQYPLHIITAKSGKQLHIPTGVIFGGANLSEDGTILLSARAITLFYYLEGETDTSKLRARQWVSAFVDLLDEIQLPDVRTYFFTSRSLADELERNTLSIAPLLPIAFVLMLVFTMVSCSMTGGRSWHEAKPWIGLLSCTTVLLAVGAATGCVALAGVPLIGIDLAAPFLMLGIGLDDTFVMLSAWRNTNPSLSVEERTAQMFGEAGVSITITSLTNIISFVIGAYSPFPSVYIFCVYSAACATCTYILQLLLLGSLIAVFGHLEALRLHGLFCYKLAEKPKNKEVLELQFRVSSGQEFSDLQLINRSKRCVFRDYVAPTLCRRPVKFFVLVIFVVYVFVAAYGCSQLQEGLDRSRLTLDESYAKDFFIADDAYFKNYPYRLQVVFNRPLNYTLAEVSELAAVVEDFETSSYVRNRALTECWFREGTNSTKMRESFRTLAHRIKLSGLADYLAYVPSFCPQIFWKNDILLPFGTSSAQSLICRSIAPMRTHRSLLIDLFTSSSRTLPSRCMVQARDVRSSNDEAAMMVELRSIADRHSAFNVTVFHPMFVFFDQYLLIRPTTAQSVAVATIVMVLVALLLLPSWWAVLWVAVAIVSIELGVVGFMTFWGVNLDSISMINLIMCIGFSVDYSAHIAHAFLAGRATTAEGRVAETLAGLGLPVLQGALSTLLGIVVLALAPSYIFLTFFKTVFLVIVFGALHALIFLPVFLSATFKSTTEVGGADAA